MRGPFHGVPIAFKDNIDVLGLPTTGGSWALLDHLPRLDSRMAFAMRRAGAVVLGKTNLDEFPFGDFGISSVAGTLALVRHWSVIRIGAATPPALAGWRVSTKEFRENLEWAVVVPGETAHSTAVVQLLDELRLRGITIHDAAAGDWQVKNTANANPEISS